MERVRAIRRQHPRLDRTQSSEERPLSTFLKNETKAPQWEHFQEEEELASLC